MSRLDVLFAPAIHFAEIPSWKLDLPGVVSRDQARSMGLKCEHWIAEPGGDMRQCGKPAVGILDFQPRTVLPPVDVRDAPDAGVTHWPGDGYELESVDKWADRRNRSWLVCDRHPVALVRRKRVRPITHEDVVKRVGDKLCDE